MKNGYTSSPLIEACKRRQTFLQWKIQPFFYLWVDALSDCFYFSPSYARSLFKVNENEANCFTSGSKKKVFKQTEFRSFSGFDKSFQNIFIFIRLRWVRPTVSLAFYLIHVQAGQTLCKFLSFDQLFIPPRTFWRKTSLLCKHLQSWVGTRTLRNFTHFHFVVYIRFSMLFLPFAGPLRIAFC